ncbi:MAG: roadblock/LC7 domain-containing protein [Planctomycetes bacterium]|nr:roadblock/LC7 domain-containing protein [Planctomycetota bacterium]
MKKILGELNQEVGVRGSLVLTPDGMVVASNLAVDLQEDLVAAIASSALQTIRRALGQLGESGFSRLVLNATYGKMVFVDLRIAYLVVVHSRRQVRPPARRASEA